MGASLSAPSGGGGASTVSPGTASTGFSSNQVVIANSSGQLASLDSASITLAFFGVAGATRASSYTTSPSATARVLPSTVSTAAISTAHSTLGTIGFASTDQPSNLIERVNALTSANNRTAEVLRTILKDLSGYGLLRSS